MKPLKIAYTVWPNGHKCIWRLVDVKKMFVYDVEGNFWFVWARLFKN